MNSTHYIVETLIGSDWENVWTEDDKPMTFTSRGEARLEIRYLLWKMPDYDAADYRIVKVSA